MQDLIERLEKATGPSGELAARIWAEVNNYDVIPSDPPWLMGKNTIIGRSRANPIDTCFLHSDSGTADKIPDYTASIDAALMLVPRNAEWECGSVKLLGTYWAEVVTINEKFTGKGVRNPAIALCIAALMARA